MDRVRIGSRLEVPFGRSRTLIGVCLAIHTDTPDFEVKEVVDLISDLPPLLPDQLKLWQWMADYYMAHLGEIYSAAMPSFLTDKSRQKTKTETYIRLHPTVADANSLTQMLSTFRNQPARLQVVNTFLRLTGWERLMEGQMPDSEPFEPEEITREELINHSHKSTAVLRQVLQTPFFQTYQKPLLRINRDEGEDTQLPSLPPLSPAQQTAHDEILHHFVKRPVVLHHGVTSGGKTVIYTHLIDRELKAGRQVLFLLPEIALTVQMTERLRKIYGNRMAIYHSKYNESERAAIWRKQLSDRPYQIIVGVRSSIFLPFRCLGLIIVDEEHEQSYKQSETSPHYHARSAAIVLARIAGAKTLLGTATPSIETYYNARCDKYGLVTLSTRYGEILLPEIQVVDQADMRRRKMVKGLFSIPLLDAVREALEQGRQVILFQNRRGFAPIVTCKDCGWTPHCEHCDVTLTMHKNTGLLSCHYCGKAYKIPAVCPKCGSHAIREKGYGTERVEEHLPQLIPGVRVMRMDLDTTGSRRAYERLIQDFSEQRFDLLIGTQMVTKGLDFDHVGVVGILDADSMLHQPDFRAYEHAFMMMSQVSGRAGRKGQRGRVILQTSESESYVIRHVVDNTYAAFYEQVIAERKAFDYPPFCRLIYIYFKHPKETVVEDAAKVYATGCKPHFADALLGPEKPPVSRVRNMHIRQIILKVSPSHHLANVKSFLRLRQKALLAMPSFKTVSVFYDVDPI